MLPADGALRFSSCADELLARHIARGSKRAEATLYERYHQPLYRYCRAILREDSDAQDALQSTFLAALSALRRGQRDAPLRPWLFRIAHNQAISTMRRRARELEPAPADGQAAAAADEEAARRERFALLLSDLAELPERPRTALLLRELNGLSHVEIAQALKTTTSGAKQAILEARQALSEFAEGRAMECEAARVLISDGDRRILRGRRVRAHLRNCAPCAAFAASIPARRRQLRALVPPIAPAAAASLLERLLSGPRSVAGCGGAGEGSGGSAGMAAPGGSAGAGPGGSPGMAAIGKLAGSGAASKLLAGTLAVGALGGAVAGLPPGLGLSPPRADQAIGGAIGGSGTPGAAGQSRRGGREQGPARTSAADALMQLRSGASARQAPAGRQEERPAGASAGVRASAGRASGAGASDLGWRGSVGPASRGVTQRWREHVTGQHSASSGPGAGGTGGAGGSALHARGGPQGARAGSAESANSGGSQDAQGSGGGGSALRGARAGATSGSTMRSGASARGQGGLFAPSGGSSLTPGASPKAAGPSD